MDYTNKLNLPEGIVNAIRNDSYDKGDAEFSATQLLQPPQMARLMKLNWHRMSIDVSEEIWKLFGSAVHHILDKGSESKVLLETGDEAKDILDSAFNLLDENTSQPEHILLNQLRSIVAPKSRLTNAFVTTEERLYGKIGGIKISGKPDWYNALTNVIDDYKVTQVYKVQHKIFKDWEDQGNIYAWLFQENDIEPSEFRIIAILKDWKPSEFTKDNTGTYPNFQVQVIPFKLKDPIERTQFVLDRVKLHNGASKLNSSLELATLYPCTPEERWHGEDSFAVIKSGGSGRAVPGGVFQTRIEAESFLITKGDGYEIEDRIGYDKRCEEFCNVKEFCMQRKQNLEKSKGKGSVELPNGLFELSVTTIAPEPKHNTVNSEPILPGSALETLFQMENIEEKPKEKEVVIIKAPEVTAVPKRLQDILNSIKTKVAPVVEPAPKPQVETPPQTITDIKDKYDRMADEAVKAVNSKNSDEELLSDINNILDGLI